MHEVLDEISLELGKRTAARLRECPDLLRVGRENLARWLALNAHAPGLVRCYREWEGLLERPLEEICHVLEDETEVGQRLRQNSPFAGILKAPEVWRIKSTVRHRHATSPA